MAVTSQQLKEEASMKVSRYPLSLVATLAVSSLALTACGGSDSDDAQEKAPQKSTAVNIKATDPAKLKQGGTMNWAIDTFATQWNITEIDGLQAGPTEVMKALMPSLWHSDARGVQSPNKAFLLDADSATVKGKQVVTWHLNPKAKWSDGTPITWKDLAANATALSGQDEAYKVTSTLGFDRIAEVKKGKDDYEAVMTFDKPYADWKAMYNASNNQPLYPAKYVSDAKSFNTAYVNKIPVTGNAFKLGGIDKSAKTVTVVADPKWWGDKPRLDKIVFHAMDSASMPGAFANGEVDYFDVGGDASAYKQATQVSAGEIREAGGPNYRQLTFNGQSAKLKDPKVRQALFMATDRETIAKSDLKGLGWKPATMNNHLLVANQKGYQDNSGKLGTYDPKAAGKLLDEAGWKLSGKVRKKGGQELSLRFVIPSSTPASTNEGSMLTQMYQQVGVKLQVQTVPVNDFFDKYITPGDFDISPYTLIGTPFPASGPANIYTAKGGNNNAKVGNKKLDDLLHAASGNAADPADSLKQVNQADAEAWQLAGVLPLYQRPDIAAIKKDLANMGALGMTDVVYEHIGFTK
ncbi:ABC transporter family substrate-binding protein [Streptomyces piniterrae]|uniref:ABC transporter family substrate-binding protein n=1 Tax=Streptomyces piniterrae TaxID=2571125 RepID=A0A4U0NWK1_9ACTN|nr:ABC transporter family substrate-binding protein [Streptomyces piniterrae]TJZ59020.1 ABC transporter family substrate-binding protein [Streptomyces piniterrae]